MTFFEKYPELGEKWFRYSETMMLITGPNGEIYDVNNAFLDWIGYSMYEFVRERDPVTWYKLTIPGDDLDADIHEVERCVRGEISSYKIRKHYIPKNSLPKLVEIYVHRYPIVGDKDDFKFFFVEVVEISASVSRVYQEMHELQVTTMKNIEQITNTLTRLESATPMAVITWLKANPMLGVPLLVIFIFLLFGRSALEIIEAAQKLF